MRFITRRKTVMMINIKKNAGMTPIELVTMSAFDGVPIVLRGGRRITSHSGDRNFTTIRRGRRQVIAGLRDAKKDPTKCMGLRVFITAHISSSFAD